MAAKKISELPDAATVTGADLIPIVQGGATVKVPAAGLPVSTASQAALNVVESGRGARPWVSGAAFPQWTLLTDGTATWRVLVTNYVAGASIAADVTAAKLALLPGGGGGGGTQPVSVVAANGATDGASLNAALTALGAAGGEVRGIAGQTYVIETPITIPNRCVLNIKGITIQRKSTLTGRGSYIIRNGAVVPQRSVTDASVVATTLGAALSTAAPITALPVAALSSALPSGALVRMIGGPGTGIASTDAYTLTAAAAAGATSLAVASKTPNFAYPSGAAVVSNVIKSATAAFVAGDVGRAVTLAGAGRRSTVVPTWPTVLYSKVLSVIDASSVLVAHTGVTAVTGASLLIHNRDKSIGLVADAATIIDNGVVAGNPHAVVFRRVDNLSMIGDGARCIGGTGGGTVFFLPGDFTRMVVSDWSMDTLMGGLQPMGPFTDAFITGMRGKVGDDMVAIQGSANGWDEFDINDVQGPVGNVTILATVVRECVFAGIKVFGGFDNGWGACTIRQVMIDGVSGTIGTQGVTIQDDLGGLTDVGDLVIRNVRVSGTNGVAVDQIYLINSTGRNCTIENAGWDDSSGTSAARKTLIFMAGGTWQSLTIKGAHVTAGDYVDIFRINGYLTHLKMIDCGVVFSTGARILSMPVSGTIVTADLSGVRTAAGGADSYLVYAGAGATINDLRLTQFHATNGPAALQSMIALKNVGQAATTVCRLSQGRVEGTGVYAIDTDVPLELHVSEASFLHTGTSVRASSAVPVRVLSERTVKWGAIANVSLVAGATLSSNGNLPVDPTVLTPVDGDTVNSTNAGIGSGVGPVIFRSAVSNWRSLYVNPTLPLAPNTFPGLVAHYKADTLGLADAAAVASWPNQVAGGPALTQATAGSQPIYKAAIQNGLGVVRFDGVDDVLIAAAALAGATGHVFVVAKYSAATFAGFNGLVSGSAAIGSNYILGGSSATALFGNPGLANQLYFKDGVNYAPTAMSGPMNAFAVMDIQSTGWASAMTLMVGQDRGLAGRFWNGDICEIAVYNVPLSAFHRQCVEAGLQAKWATPALPG